MITLFLVSFELVNAQYKGEIRSFSKIIDGDTLWGYRIGNDTIIDPTYSWADSFRDELAIVRDVKTGKYGFINVKNEVVIPFLYDEVNIFGDHRLSNNGFNNLALVNIGMPEAYHLPIVGEWGLINKKGEEVVPVKYKEICPVSEGIAFIFEGEYILHNIGVKKDGKTLEINKKGEVIRTY